MTRHHTIDRMRGARGKLSYAVQVASRNGDKLTPGAGVCVFIYKNKSKKLAATYRNNRWASRLANPLVTDSEGVVECLIRPGKYDVLIEAAWIAIQPFRRVVVVKRLRNA